MTNDAHKCLVTGGCGFIGSNLLPMLRERGMTVRVLDSFASGTRALCSGLDAEIFEGDVRDAAAVARAMDGATSVIHLAASGSVVESVADPAANFDVNVRGTFQVFDQARRLGVEQIAFASTGGALIGDATPPVDEDSLPRPISPYGASKLCGEAYCHAFARAYGMRSVALRFANVYGPRSAHKRGVITRFMKALMRDEPFVVYGDGTASRDFLYVDDLCRGILDALRSRPEPGEIFHLASGVETRIGDLARLVARIAGRPDHPVEFRRGRPGEVARNFARYDKARDAFGYEPKRTLEQGMRETWEWFREQGDAVFDVEAGGS